MPRAYVPTDFDKIFEELKTETDRGAILVGAAFVEYALEQCIRSRLREPQSNTEGNQLFGGNGVMDDFSKKIWMAYFLKIVGPISRRDLDLIRAIRNAAAHDMNHISLQETEELSNRCRDLEIAKESVPAKKMPPDFREMFLLAVHFYSANLFLRAGDSHAEIAEAFSGLAPYLDR